MQPPPSPFLPPAPIRLFDTRLRQKVELAPRQPGKVALYVCGVTVYDLCHLGHARCYVVWDVVQRHLRNRGYQVTYVRNITDVDDKIIRRAEKDGTSADAVAKRYTDEMHRDFDSLGIMRPDIEPRATEYIEEMKRHIQGLMDGGYAYPTSDGVYYRVARFARYGELSRQSPEELQAGARVELNTEKESPLDFALWKLAKPGEPAWDAPWGAGRPGWHIECSAMAKRFLGETFDIHAGGMDLIFPHHQNEIAQSEGLYGDGTFARYWMHNGFVNINAEKMSKSIGNVWTIRQACKQHDPEALRLFLLQVHYRSPLGLEVAPGQGEGQGISDGDATLPGVVDAERRLGYFYETLARLEASQPARDQPAGWPGQAQITGPAAAGPQGGLPDDLAEVAGLLVAFNAALDDDFNTALALAELERAMALGNQLLATTGGSKAEKQARQTRITALHQLCLNMGGRLGLLSRPPAEFLMARRRKVAASRGIDEAAIDAALARRAEARKQKNFALSDEIRDGLASQGIEIMDGPSGSAWRFKT